MKKSLIALSLGTFALGIAEFVMMGILSPIAHDLDVSIVDAGHLISAYALGVSFGAPMLLVLRKMPLKKLLVILACMIAAGNCLAAFSVPTEPISAWEPLWRGVLPTPEGKWRRCR